MQATIEETPTGYRVTVRSGDRIVAASHIQGTNKKETLKAARRFAEIYVRPLNGK